MNKLKLQSSRLVGLLLVVLLVISSFSPVVSHSAKRFTDVPSWGEDAIDYLVNNGSIIGYPDGTFRPHNKLTRAQAAKILAISLGLEINDDQKSTFTDTKDHWASKYVAALQTQKKDVIKGYPDNTFRPNNSITRQQMAKMIVEAYDLKMDPERKIYFSDSAGWAEDYINTLGSLGIVKGRSEGIFDPLGTVTRLQMALFVHRTENENARLEVPIKKPIPAIKHVTVFNETKFEVTFSSALGEDVANEIEHSGKRFIVYHAGQTSRSPDAIQSQTISFNDDYTKASIILENDSIRADVNYTVALIDGDNYTVADEVVKFAPVILKKGTEQPKVVLDGEQYKLILKFNEKMSNSALEARNYQIYKNNYLNGNLEEYITPSTIGEDGFAKGKWVDSTEKTAIEFLLNRNSDRKKFDIGEKYKIVVSDEVETYKGSTLSDVERTIQIETPTLAEAQPKASFARIVNNNIIVTFDKNLSEGMLNPHLVVVISPSGHAIPVENVELANEDNHLGDKEIRITVAEGYTLINNVPYTIDLPTNMVANAIFPNALNQKITNLKAQTQKDIEITSVSAKFKVQSSHKDRADLLLTFDQRVDMEHLMNSSSDAIIIKEGSSIYQLVDTNELELYYGDTTGKTVLIKDVEAVFKLNGEFDGNGFKPRYGKTYTVELKPNTVKTENGVKFNQEKLVASVSGISISPPELDKIYMESAEKIVVQFKEEIDAKNLQAYHITVQGYETYKNGNFTVNPIPLTGNHQIKFSVSGNKLTLEPARPEVKFLTFAAPNLLTIQGDTIRGKTSGVENPTLTSEDHIHPLNIIDRASPMMIGAQKGESEDTITITYSEPITLTGNNPEIQASQFTVENATKNAYGSSISLVAPIENYSQNIKVTFNKPGTFKPDLDLEKVKLIYTKNNNVPIKDKKGNKQNSQSIVGLKRSSYID